jgi:glycosyltransferase involved in cell wall biosynthesis
MGSECPLVSIGMPVHNCQETLPLALRSLLAQSYSNWELLLIDDGSSDDTFHVASRFTDLRIKVYADGKNQGLPARLNQTIAKSQGKYFARMDGDDLAYPQRLERQVDYLEQHPNVDLVGAWVIVFGADGTPMGKRTGPEAHGAICARPSAGFPIVHPTYFGRLAWFQQYSYNETMQKSQDQDLLLRSYRFSRFANVPEILLGYREEQLNLKKILRARRLFVDSLFREFRRQQRPALAIRAVVEQGIKGAIDILAVNSGLRYRLLRHRAQRITQSESEDWIKVWSQLNPPPAVTNP